MIRYLVLALLIFPAIAFSCKSFGEITAFKTLDSGGSGKFKAIAASESGLPGYVFYQPKNIGEAVAQEHGLPVVIFANGGCNDTSFPFERMLSEIASHGYLVIALGAMQNRLDDRPLKKAANEMMTEALDWIGRASQTKGGRYFSSVDMNNVAFAGQSCGGAQVLAVASDPRVKTYLMFNSGIGDMTMAKADRQSLNALHGPILYLVGGDSDVATDNAKLDYQRINHVPVAFANLPGGGHSGTFEEPLGGSFTRVALKWLDWHLNGKDANASTFLKRDLAGFDDWEIKAKRFSGT
ncbi:alpha/beta hydrolase [Alteromonas pelagimontana]|uniref:Alpha/beta hydrolase n=1 Tax=Alteromonas pelagimontana TaxID=1858656 RepID=A0A6M4MAH7_9ALTE|nr:dienelactone hydrolase family protein [Alteromonas pelagimontana]QJR80172.1 alpha/beta hydrolase [Alteromonas pelagimontana]